ncbi:MAG: hypothetical protein H6658_11265 [Ardenticatenaceae bacterium]|nr:hypothetical protein [Ardenticatenaceae bacterium]
MASTERLREAVTAVKTNHRLKARTLLRDILADEPTNEMAWIWLSEASDEMSEKIYALRQAQALNPDRAAVRQRLAQLEAHYEADELKDKDRLADVVVMAGDGRFQEARDRLLKIAAKEQDNVPVWLLLGVLVDNIEDKLVALENVLQLEPYHGEAQKLLKLRQQGEVDKLTQGRAYEQRQDWKNAVLAYETAVIISPIAQERDIAKKRLEAITQFYDPYLSTHPTLTLLRLTAGPPILFGLLVLVHSGLNPLRIPLASCLGGLAVVVGSLLWTAVRDSAKHPLWQKIPPVVQENRNILPIVGFILALIPFLILIFNTINRLELYQATFP